MLGHERFGSGPVPVVVTHDWLCDTSTWDPVRPYLDPRRASWWFVDLRGYGRSRDLPGSCSFEEAVADLLAFADERGLRRFVMVGHSMSSLLALHLAQHAPERVSRAALITPPPARSFGHDEATVHAMQEVALGDDARRARMLDVLWGDRLGPGYRDLKLARWRERAQPGAVAAYVPLFARRGVPNPGRGVSCPVLAITGELDAEPMRGAAVERWLAPLCSQLELSALPGCGHYPMEEQPPAFAARVQRFVTAE
jgi:3-oxoadipate enol-lactonase